MLPLQLEAADGSIAVGPLPLRIGAALTPAQAGEAFAGLLRAPRDLGNGYHWLHLQGLSLQGVPAGAGLCFHGRSLRMVTFGVHLPGAPLQDGWPTQAAIDAEVAFMRRVLGTALGRPLSGGHARFDWGQAWARFDPKGFMASSGLRYGHD
ncbi:hypothetical protein [Stenotrophomonas sp. 24(2023)]|uniref:hypothetical protein n=1 Tax=Stenotrophomonas sp. 24(2023) TaxID=3068324 RepID=UPI0027DFB879|nr:hypothetical protein [Stenotrophomonas sp. 24(2023)]WMJ71547.1 hypothetical protein Q9R17_01875 [Stenotrophomonas sp. 24(2023)]